MKNIFRSALCLTLCTALLLSLCACASIKRVFGDYALQLGSVTMEEEIYAYYMSCYRPYWIYTFGEDDTEQFWSSSSNGITVSDYLQDVSLTAIKSKLVAEYLFSEYHLTLSDEKKAEVEAVIDGLLLGIGGREEFEKDELMKQLGLTVDDMHDVFISDAKSAAVQDYLYGESGKEIVTKDDRDAYYNSNYYRYKHLYIMDVDYVRDENGKIVFDSDGYAKWQEISDERWDEKFTHAQSLLQRAQNGEDFDDLIVENTEELGYERYLYGHYFNKQAISSSTYFSAISDQVMKMAENEVQLIRSEYGLHLLLRLPLDDEGYKHTENGEDFKNFDEYVEEEKFKTKLQGYFDQIKVNEKVINKYRIDEVPYSESWTYLF